MKIESATFFENNNQTRIFKDEINLINHLL